jgi:thiol-disulfide isomerase/thioredoxin
MPRRRLSLSLALLLALALPLSAGAPGREKVPPFTLTTLDGKQVRSSELKGKVVLLDFWATWCIPCIKGLPDLKALAQRMAGEPFILVGVSEDARREDAAAFVKKNGLSWMQAWDGTGTIGGGLFKVEDLPTQVLLDHEGAFLYRQRGWAPGRSASAIEAQVVKAVAEARKASAKPEVAR